MTFPLACRSVYRGTLLLVSVTMGLASFASSFVTTAQAQEDLSIEQLAGQLASSEVEERRDAAYALVDRGPASVGAIDALIKGLNDNDTQVWWVCTRALAGLGAAAEPAVEELLQHLDDNDEQRRYRTAHALGQIGPAAMGALTERLGSEKARARMGALQGLGWMGQNAAPAIEAISPLLDDGDAEIRRLASETMSRIGAPAVESLIGTLKHGSIPARIAATQALGAMGEAAEPAVPELIVLTTADDGAKVDGGAADGGAADSGAADGGAADSGAADGADKAPEEDEPAATPTLSSPELHAAVVSALGAIAPSSPEIMPPLLAAIQDADVAVQTAAVDAWTRLDPTLLPLATESLHMLLRASDDVAAKVAFVLGEYGEPAAGAIPRLLDRVGSTDAYQDFAKALGKIGEPAIDPILEGLRQKSIDASQVTAILDAMPAQIKVRFSHSLNDPNAYVREVAARTIGNLVPTPRDAGSSLTKALHDPEPRVRLAAAEALTSLGAKGDVATETLVTLLHDDSDAPVRAAAATALGRVAVDRDAVAAVFGIATRDPNPDVRREVLAQLSSYAVLPSDMHEPIAMTLRDDPDPSVRAASPAALVLVADRQAETMKWLLQALQDPDRQVRLRVLQAIPRVAGQGAQAVSVVADLLRSDDIALRLTAIETLAAIGHDAAPAFDRVVVLAQEPETELRAAAVKNLTKLTTPDIALPPLIRALDDEAWEVRQFAAVGLGELKEDAVTAVPALLSLLRRDDDNDAARGALREIGTATDEALPILLEIIDDESVGKQTRFFALFMLREMGAKAAAALPILQKQLEQADSRGREYLQRTIREIGSEVVGTLWRGKLR